MFRRRTPALPVQAPAVEPASPRTSDELPLLQSLDVFVGSGDPEPLAARLAVTPFFDDREKCILRLRLGLDRGGAPRSIQEVSQELGVAGSRIRQLESRALAEVRAHYRRTRA